MLNGCMAHVPMPLLALKPPLALPMTIGVPVIAPVVAFNVKPCGNAPTTPKTGGGTPLAVSVNAYGIPYVPLGGELLVNCGACVLVVFASAKLAVDPE